MVNFARSVWRFYTWGDGIVGTWSLVCYKNINRSDWGVYDSARGGAAMSFKSWDLEGWGWSRGCMQH